MPSLFSEFRLKDITLKNRIGVSPMCQYSATDGLAGDWHLVHLGARAIGGAALVIAEADPHWPFHAAKALDLADYKTVLPLQYRRVT